MLLSIFAFLTALINPIATVTGKLADAKVALAKAETDKEKIGAQERVNTLTLIRDVQVAQDANSKRVDNIMRVLLALPFVLYNAKLVVWDKMLEWGSTDGLSEELFWIECAVISFYFISIMRRK